MILVMYLLSTGAARVVLSTETSKHLYVEFKRFNTLKNKRVAKIKNNNTIVLIS